MKKIRHFTNNSLWWFEINLLNTNNIKFKYLLNSNIFFLNLSYKFYYFYHLICKYSLNTLLFSNLDTTLIKSKNNNIYYNSSQTIFCDFKILLNVNIQDTLISISSIYRGNIWVEREIREFYNIFILNLNDTRKLLLNYNYNSDLIYNNFNNIINDINI